MLDRFKIVIAVTCRPYFAYKISFDRHGTHQTKNISGIQDLPNKICIVIKIQCKLSPEKFRRQARVSINSGGCATRPMHCARASTPTLPTGINVNCSQRSWFNCKFGQTYRNASRITWTLFKRSFFWLRATCKLNLNASY